MFGFEDLLQPEETPKAKRPKSPPKSCEEWFAHEGMRAWPAAPSILEEGIRCDPLGSLQDIKDDLRRHSLWDSAFLEGISQRLHSLEVSLAQCADRFICEPAPSAKESVAGGLANIRDKTFLTELCEPELLASRRLHSNYKRSRKSKLDEDERSAEAAVFLENSMVTLPGKLEARPILDLVTKLQTFPPYLSRSWRKLFYSDASCSIFQNTFWWVWMEWFKPNPTQQNRLFDMTADSFAALLSVMDHKHKDEVFGRYPPCLAQALFTAFCHAFPASTKTFNTERFLSYLTDLTSEWIAGVRSPPLAWKRWCMARLDPYHSKSTRMETESSLGKTFTEKDVLQMSLSRRLPTRHQSSRHHSRKQSSMALARQPSALSRSTHQMPEEGEGQGVEEEGQGVEEEEEESVTLGPGPTFECVRFSLLGRSPLLQHYLLTHGLADDSYSGPAIGRMQVKELPAPSMSYKQLLEKLTAISTEKYEAYERYLTLSTQRIATTHKDHVTQLREMDRQNEKVLQHKYEVAILAEKLMAKSKALPPIRTKKPAAIPK